MNEILKYFLYKQLTNDIFICLGAIIVIGVLVQFLWKTNNKKGAIGVLGVIIIITMMAIGNNRLYTNYTIDEKPVYIMKYYSNIIKDSIREETLEIETKDISIVSTRKSTSRGLDYTVYYLDINVGEYVIPIKDANKVNQLLNKNERGDVITNKITVYKNSKLIKCINDVEV